MTDEPALLAAVRAAPDEDTPRLVYADWLEENAGTVECRRCEGAGFEGCYLGSQGLDGPDCPDCGCHGVVPDGRLERAEFIRVQVEEARQADGGASWRVCELAQRFPVAGFQVFANPVSFARITGGPPAALYRRGFIDAVTCPAADWLVHADVILAAHPVRRVTLTTWPTVESFASSHPPYRLTSWFPGRIMRVETWEEELVLRLRPGANIAPPDGEQLRHAAVVRLLELEWPGITFELPPTPNMAMLAEVLRAARAGLPISAHRMADALGITLPAPTA